MILLLAIRGNFFRRRQRDYCFVPPCDRPDNNPGPNCGSITTIGRESTTQLDFSQVNLAIRIGSPVRRARGSRTKNGGPDEGVSRGVLQGVRFPLWDLPVVQNVHSDQAGTGQGRGVQASRPGTAGDGGRGDQRLRHGPRRRDCPSRRCDPRSARRGLLVRHLAMPGGLDETCEILRFLARDVSADTFVNVTFQYRPKGLVGQYPAINRPLARASSRRRGPPLAK